MSGPTRDFARADTLFPSRPSAQSASYSGPPLTQIPSGSPSTSRTNLMNDRHSHRYNRGRRWFKVSIQGWRILFLGSWLNLLLIVVPVAWIFSFAFPELKGFIFIFCIIALVPLIKMHEVATRELSIRIGGSKAGLVNASLSNIVAFVVAVIALRKCELRILQSSLIGSILSKLLLILGLCFFAGGIRHSEQVFDPTANHVNSYLLNVSMGVFVFPVAFHLTLSGDTNGIIPETQKQALLSMSRGVSVILIFIYVLYLLFQLVSHTHLYEDWHKQNRRLSKMKEKLKKRISNRFSSHPGVTRRTPHQESFPDFLHASPHRRHASEIALAKLEGKPLPDRAQDIGVTSGVSDGEFITIPISKAEKEHPSLGHVHFLNLKSEKSVEDPEKGSPLSPTHHPKATPQMSWALIILALIFVTTSVAITVEELVSSMDGISEIINKIWVALVLLPAVSSIAEGTTAIGGSVKDQLTLSINVAAGASIQTAFFVYPLMVIVAWSMNKPLSLLLDPFDAIVLFISVQATSFAMGNGKSNWLEGAVLICLYLIIAVAFWFYPGPMLPASLGEC